MAIANYAKACEKNVPGIIFLAYTEIANISSITVTAGEISAITMVATETFHEFDDDIDSTQLTMEGKGANSFMQTNKIEASFSKLTKELITAKQSLVDAVVCGAAVIVTDGNGQPFLVGYNENEGANRPLNNLETNFTSGKKPSDEDTQKYILTISGESGYDPTPFDSTLTATITGGTATFITFN